MRNIFKNTKLSLSLLAVVVLLIFLHWVGILLPVENLFIRVLTPIQSRVYSTGTSINNLYLTVSGKNIPLRISQELEEEIQRLTANNAQLQVQLEETEALLVQQKFISSLDIESITARVIGQNPEPDIQAIILDKGTRHGVGLDMPLITDQGIMVGKISKVRLGSSEAILINDSASRVSVVIQNDTKTQGVVVGEHGLSLTIELIPQNEEVNVDDIVVTAGVEPTIPRGLVIGKVTRVSSEPNSLFQTVRVRSFVKVNRLTIVSILRNQIDD